MTEWLALMYIIHDDAAYEKDNRPSRSDNQRVGEKLCPGVMLDVIPSPLKRGENIDKKKRIHKHKYQKEDDIVPGDIVFGYIFTYHYIQKRIRKDTIFSFSALF